jgi:hypothetical protein
MSNNFNINSSSLVPGNFFVHLVHLQTAVDHCSGGAWDLRCHYLKVSSTKRGLA